MDIKKINVMWSVSLFVVGIASIIFLGFNYIGEELPDIAKRILGVINFIALPVLSYSTVRKVMEGKYHNFSKKIIVPVTEKSRFELLKEYATYDLNKHDKSYTFKFLLGGEIPKVLEKYRYSEYFKDVEPLTDMVAFRLLDFVCDHFFHDGTAKLGSKRRIVDIIAYCESNEGKANCRGLSILLASLLRLNGIKARHITCMPYEEPFNDCHVVVDCLLPSGKRIMFDPTWRLYLKDASGEYLSLEQFRKMLIKDEAVFENPGASHNGTGFSKEYYREYMIKNMLRFSSGTLLADGEDSRVRQVELIPKDYPIDKFHNKARFVYCDSLFWKI